VGERGDLFLIDHCKWPKICELGMNAAISYLIMARGSGPDNSQTSWSANAIEQRTGMSRKRAGDAIRLMVRRNHLSMLRGSTMPKYKIGHTRHPSWAYLPNSLIDGAAGEVSPIERLRRRGSIEALRMLIDAYQMQDLANDDGLDWRLIHSEWDRSLITERGNWLIFGYSKAVAGTAKWHCPLRVQFRHQTNEANAAFWNAFQTLKDCGLIETIPHLVEGSTDNAELIFPLHSEGSEAETSLCDAATQAARSMLENDAGGFKYSLDAYEIAIPVSNDFPNATVVGVFRLRYRAHTSLTAAWWSKQTEWNRYAEQYRALFADPEMLKLSA
jgi:hypothetical protein